MALHTSLKIGLPCSTTYSCDKEEDKSKIDRLGYEGGNLVKGYSILRHGQHSNNFGGFDIGQVHSYTFENFKISHTFDDSRRYNLSTYEPYYSFIAEMMT